ncbi:hypothetical protein [Pseudoalteromonas ulvae]|uniref:hypothetical protein n=1 Tax=Pseudoalteromonas ulvae TaxID=107327 RepID=UPI00186B7154|nr:hypothetical protein [Pseudoalteromonas ulvae]
MLEYLFPLLMIPIYAGIFYIVLKWLKVDTHRVKRSFILASTLAAIELACNLIVFTFELDGTANTILSIGIFVFVIRKLLILKLWQAVVIPMVVTATGYLILAVFLMVFFQFFASSSTGI